MGHVVYKLHCNSISVSVFTMFNNEQDPQEAALEEEEVLLVAMALMVRGRRQRRRRRVRNRKRFWVRPWLLRRPLYGQYEHLMQELYGEDVKSRDGLFQSYDKRMDFVFRRMGVV